MGRPAVTSQFVSSPGASATAQGDRVLAIIGTGSTTYTIQEAVVRGAGTTDSLANVATAIVKIGDYKGTAEYVATTDYLLTGGDVDWSPAGVGSKEPVTAATYYVTYTYVKVPADYEPYLSDNMDDILANSGAITVTSGVLQTASYLSAAAEIAFNVGVRQVIICQVAANTAAEFAVAYAKLENPVNSVNPYYIVPLLGSLATSGDFDTARGTALTHVNKMSSEEFGKERQLYTGKKDYTGAGFGVDDFTLLASSLATSRVILAGNYDPLRQMTESTTGVSVSVTLDGCFQALMLAAFRSSQALSSDPAMNRPITGAFTGWATVWGDIDIDNLVDGSVCVCEVVQGVITIVDDITTNNADEVEVDIATVEARDVLIMGNRAAVSKKFKGARGDNAVSGRLKAFENTYLVQRLGDGLIAGIGAVAASRQAGSIRKWQITFTYLPVTKVRDIKITFSVDLGLAS